MQVNGAGGAGNGERTAIQPVIAVPKTPEQVPLTPSIIDTPLTGSRFKNDVPVELKGRAHPGSLVTLFYRFEDLPEEALVEAWTDEEGRFRFQLQGFGAGRYQFRIQARTADGRQQVSLPAEYLFVRPR
jgi:hypothetical protein